MTASRLLAPKAVEIYHFDFNGFGPSKTKLLEVPFVKNPAPNACIACGACIENPTQKGELQKIPKDGLRAANGAGHVSSGQ